MFLNKVSEGFYFTLIIIQLQNMGMIVKNLVHFMNLERCTIRTICGVKLVDRVSSAGLLVWAGTDNDCEGLSAS